MADFIKMRDTRFEVARTIKCFQDMTRTFKNCGLHSPHKTGLVILRIVSKVYIKTVRFLSHLSPVSATK